jgi:hypothetical protein
MMKKLSLALFFCVCAPVFAQFPKAKPVEIPYKEYFTWYRVPLLKALTSEVWTVTHTHSPEQVSAKELEYFYLQAEKPSFSTMKWKVTVLLSNGVMSVWFYFANSDGSLKGLQESELGNPEKSLLEELKKVAASK